MKITSWNSLRLSVTGRATALLTLLTTMAVAGFGQGVAPTWLSDPASDLIASYASRVVELDDGRICFVETVKPAGQDDLISELVLLTASGEVLTRERILAGAQLSVDAFSLVRGGGDTLTVGVREHVPGFFNGRLFLQSFVVDGDDLRTLAPAPLDGLRPGTLTNLRGTTLLARPGTGSLIVTGVRPRDADLPGPSLDFVALVNESGEVLWETTSERAGERDLRGVADVAEFDGGVYVAGLGGTLARLDVATGASAEVVLPFALDDYGGFGAFAVKGDSLFYAVRRVVDVVLDYVDVYVVEAESAVLIHRIDRLSTDPVALAVEDERITLYTTGCCSISRTDYDRSSDESTEVVMDDFDFSFAKPTNTSDNYAISRGGDLLLATATNFQSSTERDDIQGAQVYRLTFAGDPEPPLYDAVLEYELAFFSAPTIGINPDGGVNVVYSRQFIGVDLLRYTPQGELDGRVRMELPEEFSFVREAAFAPDGRIYLLVSEAFTSAIYELSAAGVLTATYPLEATLSQASFSSRLFPNDDGGLTAVFDNGSADPGPRQLVLQFGPDLLFQNELSFPSSPVNAVRQTRLLDDGGLVHAGTFPDADGETVYEILRVNDAGEVAWRYRPVPGGERVDFVRMETAPEGEGTVVLYYDARTGSKGYYRLVLDESGGVVAEDELNVGEFGIFTDLRNFIEPGILRVRRFETNANNTLEEPVTYLARIDTTNFSLQLLARVPKPNSSDLRYVEADGRGYLAGLYRSGYQTVPFVAGYATAVSPVEEAASAKTRTATLSPSLARPGADIRVTGVTSASHLLIVDAVGRVVATPEVRDGVFRAPALPTGVYRVTGRSEEGGFAGSLVVAR